MSDFIGKETDRMPRICGQKGFFMTARVKKLKAQVLATKRVLCSERSTILTDSFRQTDGQPIEIRRAKAFYKFLIEKPITVWNDELIVGGQTEHIRGAYFYPEFCPQWMKNELETLKDREVAPFLVKENDKQTLSDTAQWWMDRATLPKARVLWHERYGNWVDDAVQAGAINLHESNTLIGGRRIVDYPKVLNIGLNGVIDEAEEGLRSLKIATRDDIRKHDFLQAVVISCLAVIGFAKRYAELARKQAEREVNGVRKKELERIGEICEWVPANPARTFYEALQSMFFVHLGVLLEISYNGYSPGRFDQYMYPFYKRDIEEGRITKEEVGELLSCFFIKLMALEDIRGGELSRVLSTNLFPNLTIGGQTTDGTDATNELSYLILDVTEDLKQTQPSISIRYHDGLPERFLLRGAEVVEGGNGMPAWFNDKAGITALVAQGIPLEEARDWSPIGCVETGLQGSSPLFAGVGFVNLPKMVELSLNNGVDPLTGKKVGLETGEAKEFRCFDELWDAIKKQLAFFTERVINLFNIRYSLYSDLTPTPFNSALIKDCIKNCKDVTTGGARHNQLVLYGPKCMIDAANSLAAIKKLVYEEKAITMPELVEALAVNFEGREKILKACLNAPKYGNDEDYVDQIAKDLYQMTAEAAKGYKNWLGAPVPVAWLGITWHWYFGEKTGALPSGRKAYTILTDGTLSAYPGTDKKGPTALIKSASKVDMIRGVSTLLNMKFSPQAISGIEGKRKFLSLVKTFFDLSGYHMQFNVVSKETLLAAQREPEKYSDLVVRVAGFSAYWSDLSRAVQDEVITRTEHSF